MVPPPPPIALSHLRAVVVSYIGQAAIKTKGMMDKAIGKVLFIDEAYGLNPNLPGSCGATFMQEVRTKRPMPGFRTVRPSAARLSWSGLPRQFPPPSYTDRPCRVGVFVEVKNV